MFFENELVDTLLRVEDPSSAPGGIAPSIPVLVMRCKALLSLSIQPVGGRLR
jgi:hypothetical protein